MPAATYDILIEQGATFELPISWKIGGSPVDLTGYSAYMQIRGDAAAAAPALSLTNSTPAGIVLGGTAGTIQITITAAQTAALSLRSGVYDLLLQAADGKRTRLLEGAVTVSPGVTQP